MLSLPSSSLLLQLDDVSADAIKIAIKKYFFIF